MSSPPLDAVDEAILYHLQRDAMQPITAIADAVNVADNTVRNRIEKLESAGVIDGYTVNVDYDRAGIQHYYLFICTTRVAERERLASEAQRIPGVVEVITVMTGTENVQIKAAAPTKDDITAIAYRLDELGLAIDREHLIWSHTHQPFSGFRTEDIG